MKIKEIFLLVSINFSDKMSYLISPLHCVGDLCSKESLHCALAVHCHHQSENPFSIQSNSSDLLSCPSRSLAASDNFKLSENFTMSLLLCVQIQSKLSKRILTWKISVLHFPSLWRVKEVLLCGKGHLLGHARHGENFYFVVLCKKAKKMYLQ